MVRDMCTMHVCIACDMNVRNSDLHSHIGHENSIAAWIVGNSNSIKKEKVLEVHSSQFANAMNCPPVLLLLLLLASSFAKMPCSQICSYAQTSALMETYYSNVAGVVSPKTTTQKRNIFSGTQLLQQIILYICTCCLRCVFFFCRRN